MWLCTTLSDEVRELLKDMMENDIIGPYCPPAYFENLPIATNITPDWNPNILSCTNYDVSKYMDGSDHLSVPVGMSQISNADYHHENIFAQDSLQYQNEKTMIHSLKQRQSICSLYHWTPTHQGNHLLLP